MDAKIDGLDKVCPECGISLVGVDYLAHAYTHWPEYLDPAKSSKEARKRQALLYGGGVSKAKYDEMRKEG